MGEIIKFKPEKLVAGILSTVPGKIEELISILSDKFGEIDYQSSRYDFNFTDYYIPEMGPDIKRFFLAFRELVSPDRLSEIKKETNQIEKKFCIGSKRKINIDPGLLSLNRFILATTKDNGHRIPLNSGIYGEVTLIYMKKGYSVLPWTYADYKSPEYHHVLEEIRKIYKQQLKQEGN